MYTKFLFDLNKLIKLFIFQFKDNILCTYKLIDLSVEVK